MSKLLVATHNWGKVGEYAAMLRDLDVAWLSLADVQITHDVVEDGDSFSANAWLKAEAYAPMAKMLTLAEDSGLEVDALGGEPGIYTARYGGAGLTHRQRYELLLENLTAVPLAERTARFRCVIALADETGARLHEVSGVCEGRIALEPRGEGGFGYDPVFVPVGQGGRTMAEVDAAVKHRRSHRGQALAALAPLLRDKLV